MTREFKGYAYRNPEAGSLEKFQVVPSQPDDCASLGLAVTYQEIMLDAWKAQFAHIPKLDEEHLRMTVDPGSAAHVTAQEQALRDSQTNPDVYYVHARVASPSAADGWLTTGIGKIKVADNRSRLLRHLPGPIPESAKLADLSDVFVRPELWGRGHGAAMAFTLLGLMPPDRDTIVYDYVINRRLLNTLARYGFRQRSSVRCIEQFGTDMSMATLDGPTVGNLTDRVVDRHRWLEARQELAA